MAHSSASSPIEQYWGREGLEDAILRALAAAGKNLDALTLDDLAPADQFHGGGKPATDRLARLSGLRPGLRVLDVGGGLGGPARTLAREHGCRVTVVDLTESYVRTGRALTARLGLGDRVTHEVGDALALAAPPGAVDLIWTQNSGMNLRDKEALYAGFARVLRPGGRVALQEPMAGPVQPVVYPVMWAKDSASSFLRTPVEMRAVVEAAGFGVLAWENVTLEMAPPPGTTVPVHGAPRIIMGDRLEAILEAGRRNREEGRIVTVQAVLERR